MKAKQAEAGNVMIDALLSYYCNNMDKFPMAARIGKEAEKASGNLDKIIESKFTEGQEEALQELMDVFNEAQRSGFYAGFQVARELFTA